MTELHLIIVNRKSSSALGYLTPAEKVNFV